MIWSHCSHAHWNVAWTTLKKHGRFSSRILLDLWMKHWTSFQTWYDNLNGALVKKNKRKKKTFVHNYALKYVIFDVDPQQRSIWPKTTWCHRGGDNQELHHGAADECHFHHTVVPDETQTIFVISFQRLFVQPQFQNLQLWELPKCVSMDNGISELHKRYLRHEDMKSFLTKSDLFSFKIGWKLSVVKNHSWQRNRSSLSLLPSSFPSCQEGSCQVHRPVLIVLIQKPGRLRLVLVCSKQDNALPRWNKPRAT